VAETFLANPAGSALGFWLADLQGRASDPQPGQFYTFLVEVNGEVLRRAYSVSSAREDPRGLRFVVKRTGGGLVSNLLADTLRAGDLVQVLGPSGSFVLPPADGAPRHHVFIGGGSGITPLLAMLHEVAAAGAGAAATLLYGNGRLDDVILRDEVDGLDGYDGRIEVRHVLAEPPAGWSGGVGILDAETVSAEVDRMGVDTADPSTRFYLCGPEPMMDAARQALAARGVDSARIAAERYGATPGRATAARPTERRTVLLRRGGRVDTVVVEPGEAILDAGLRQGVPLRFSCAMGGCAECRVKLVDGEVALDEPNCLTAAERDDGWVLTCVGWPATDATLEAR
jgi:ferredoxin-NADP reductase